MLPLVPTSEGVITHGHSFKSTEERVPNVVESQCTILGFHTVNIWNSVIMEIKVPNSYNIVSVSKQRKINSNG